MFKSMEMYFSNFSLEFQYFYIFIYCLKYYKIDYLHVSTFSVLAVVFSCEDIFAFENGFEREMLCKQTVFLIEIQTRNLIRAFPQI